MSTLLHNGNIYSKAVPNATAMLISGERIAWVGTDGRAAPGQREIDKLVDLSGALVTPAFVDAHVHVTRTAFAELGVDASKCRSLAEFLDQIAEHARSHPGEPVIGQGWDEHSWPERRAPTRAEIDRVTNGEDVLVGRVDGHSSIVSTALLKRVPAIVHADGYETDLVRRQAQTLARRAVDDGISDTLRVELHRTALRRVAALGIGAVHEMAAPHITSQRDVRALVALTEREPLPDVVLYWGQVGGGIDRARSMGARGAAGDLTVDGSIGSRSARLREAYADDPSTRGRLYLDLPTATEHVVSCTQAGMQAGFHCIGDEAVRVAVTAIVRAAEQCGVAEVIAARHRLEHVEMISPDLIEQMARLGVVASVQPAFDERWGGPGGMYVTRLGADRAAAMNPFGAMVKAGVRLAFGSDSPVTPPGGWQGIRAAASHQTASQRLSVADAFDAATLGGWWAAGVNDAGLLAAGMLATYAVWDAREPRLPDLSRGVPRCLRTVVRGQTVYEARP